MVTAGLAFAAAPACAAAGRPSAARASLGSRMAIATAPRVPSLAVARARNTSIRAAASDSSASTGGATGSRPGSTSSSSIPPPIFPTNPADMLKKGQEANELLREIISTIIKTGPAGPARALKAAQAVIITSQEFAAGNFSEPLPVIIRKLFERLGATYIKLGQFIASSPTLFPPEYVLEFQKCLDQTAQVPYSTVQSIIRQELGRPISEVFSSIDEKPLASASIAQVHLAVLKESNKQVVVKVLKPQVEDTLLADLNFLYIAAKVLQFINPELARTSVVNILEDIRSSMMEEVDFVKEAGNIQAFTRYLDDSGITAATAPYVYNQFTSKRLLTMEYLQGVPLTDLDAIRSVTNNDPEATLVNALNTWFGSVLACESFHADVHAGNLLVLRDGRVGFIDFGIVGKIKPGTWSAIQAFLVSASSENYDTMARALVTMGATDEEVDTDAFAADLAKLFAEINELDSQVVVDSTLSEDGYASVAAGVSFDEQQVNKLVIDIVQDRYVRLLAPELQVMTDKRIQMAREMPAGGPPPFAF